MTADAPPPDGSDPSARSKVFAGETCWRIARADRFAVLVDVAAYFSAARMAMLNARRRILLIGWDFDPRTRLEPDKSPDELDLVGPFLMELKRQRPELDIRILVWDMALPIAYFHDFYPQRGRSWFDERVDLRFDATAPAGACHHQKILLIDDTIAFTGGGDFAPDRWDTSDHPDDSPHRILPNGEPYDARHDIMALVDGEAAQALAELAAQRWLAATGEALPALPAATDGDGAHDPWPHCVTPDFRHPLVAIARTGPATDEASAIRENEALYLAAIRSARRSIYLENQYFASTVIADALAERLAEPDGPEVILVLSAHSPSLFDQLAMDSPRDALVEQLRKADRYGRLRVFAPHTAGGKVVIVHSKVAIIDDDFVRVGSSNLNNRSFGFDTECDVAIEATQGPIDATLRQAIIAFRDRLVGHFLELAGPEFAVLIARHGSLGAAIENAPSAHRMKPIEAQKPGLLGYAVARWHLGDPADVDDAWQPWKRTAGQSAVA